ncbi:amidohydrolase family protein [Nonomuraea sp. B5E05]|uniref:N-acyl-D-amino-acid deacylase family protein n=1 Tax=Nonomuraea sp. B5E05 TaxID=3153569 RepID=UPI0032605C6B
MDPARPYGTTLVITGGRVSYVGDDAVEIGPDTEVIEAAGRIVCPGFIDLHTHTDLDLFDHPSYLLFQNYLRQGITTVLAGNCGMAKMPPGELLARLDAQPPAVNFGTLVAHGYARMACGIPDGRRKVTEAQLQTLLAMVGKGLADGAFGMSTGLEYIPGLSTRTAELTACASVVAGHGGFYASHMRSEGDDLLAAVEEAIRIGRDSGVQIQLSHLKTDGACNQWKTAAVIAAIEAARADGLDVAGDQYPYTFFGWNPSIFIPSELLIEKDRQDPEQIKAAILDRITRYHNGNGDLVVVFDWTDTSQKRWQGITLSGILKARGVEATPEGVADLILEMLPFESQDTLMGTDISSSDESVKRYLALPYVSICTDGFNQPWLAPCHPRNYSAFPKVLGEYVRDKQALPLETALRKMTAVPAAIMGLTDRGVLRTGNHADIVIFDEATIGENATFATPAAPSGIDYVLVNGVITVESGNFRGVTPGMVLRSRQS